MGVFLKLGLTLFKNMKKTFLLFSLSYFIGSCNMYSEEAGKAADVFCECSKERDFDSNNLDAYNQWIICLNDHEAFVSFYGIEGIHDFNKMNTEEEKTYELYSALDEKCPDILDKVHGINQY